MSFAVRSVRRRSPTARWLFVLEKSECLAIDRSQCTDHWPFPRGKSTSSIQSAIDSGMDGQVQCFHLPITEVMQTDPRFLRAISPNFFSSSLRELAAWFTHFLSQQPLFRTYYESWALVRTHDDNDLFERLTNQLEKLSPLSFRVKYTLSISSVPHARLSRSSSTLSSPKKFNVRVWLRDRKTQVKVSPKELQSLPPAVNASLRRKSASIPVSKRP